MRKMETLSKNVINKLIEVIVSREEFKDLLFNNEHVIVFKFGAKRFRTYRKRNLKKSKLRRRKKTLKRKKSRKKQYIWGGGGVDEKMRQTDLITSNPFSAFGQSFRFIPNKLSDILPGLVATMKQWITSKSMLLLIKTLMRKTNNFSSVKQMKIFNYTNMIIIKFFCNWTTDENI